MFNQYSDNVEKLLRDYEAHLRNINSIDYTTYEQSSDEIMGLDGLSYGFDPEPVNTANFEAKPISRAYHGELAKKILPFIKDALCEHDYKRKPISGDNPEPRALCDIIEKSMQRAALDIDAIKDIMMEPKGGAWDRRDLLYGVFEGIVVGEIQ